MERPVGRRSMAAALGALALMQRYSLQVSRVADRTLTQGGAPDLDIQLLTTIHLLGGASPSQVAAAVRRPRSTVSRSIARAMDQGLIERFTDCRDRRRADLQLTPVGTERVEAFARAMADAFLVGAPLVREITDALGRDPDDRGQRPVKSTLEVAGLMSAAGGRFSQDVAPVMWRYRLTGAVDRYALVLVAHRGQVRPAQLASELMLTPAGTSSLLERLEARGLLVRESGTVVGDGRGVLVRLTPAGSEAVAAVLRVFLHHQDALVDALTQSLTVRATAAA